jgi:peptide/nickel transport system ATP-binding protein
MAMACKPDLIVFDEPTTALDVTTQIEVLAAIKDAIRELNTAAIYISHDLAVVAQVSDRIMVLRYGETVEVGKTREMIAAPREEYTRDLLSVRKVREEKVHHPEEGEILLQVKDISASYGGSGGVPVLEDITLALTRCNTTAVVGESGSGKSTLARVITGLLPPTRGSVIFEGQALPPHFKHRDKEMLRRLQMIYQMPDVALNPRQKVHEVLGRPLSFYFGMEGKERRDRVVELLDQIELSERYMDRFPSELSGGEKQRVCIARALAAKPDMIICDEVTSALDQLVADGILRLLQHLQNELKVSYLFITHDLALAKYFAWEGRITVMYLGRIVEEGPTPRLITDSRHPYTQALLGAVPEADPELAKKKLHIELRSAEIPSLLNLPTGCSFHPRCPYFVPGECDAAVPTLEGISDGGRVACPVRKSEPLQII